MTTIMLADDHHVVRQGLRALLEGESDFSVVGEAGDGLKVVELVERLKPDVLLLDVLIPGLNGLDVARQVSKRTPRTRIVMLSMYDNEAYVAEALRNGASAYVLKEASATDLIAAIRHVMTGGHYLSPPLSEPAIDAYLERLRAGLPDVYEMLTPREREVLQLVAEGHSTTQIANRLVVSPRTIETHRAHVMHKLGLKTQADLIRYALQRGILPMEK